MSITSNQRQKSSDTQPFKDALYTESTVYPHIDLVIGNIIEKVFIYFAHPDLIKEFVSGNVIHKYHKYSKLAEPLKLVFG